jgi:hypothetical protein
VDGPEWYVYATQKSPFKANTNVSVQVFLRSAREPKHHRQVPPSPRPLSTALDGRAEGGLPTPSRESVVRVHVYPAYATNTDIFAERLFCETLRSVFLGEGSQHCEDSLVMGMHNESNDYGFDVEGYPVRLMDSPEPENFNAQHGVVSDWIEMWDYVGGIRFRGFVAEKEDEKAMFVFFDQSVVVGDLKAG